MGEKNIGIVHGDAKLSKSGTKGVPAGILTEAGVYQQIAVAGDHIDVEIFQGISRQRHRDGVEIDREL